jgi:hypothetical protein
VSVQLVVRQEWAAAVGEQELWPGRDPRTERAGECLRVSWLPGATLPCCRLDRCDDSNRVGYYHCVPHLAVDNGLPRFDCCLTAARVIGDF